MALVRAIADGRLAASIAQSASMLKSSLNTLLHSRKEHEPVFSSLQKAPIEDEEECSSDDEDMNALRSKAKKASRAVVANGCLPADFVRQTRPTTPFGSIAVLQESMDVLQDILSQPSESVTCSKERVVAPAPAAPIPPQTVQIVAATPHAVTRPASPKDEQSRPASRCASRCSSTSAARPPTAAQVLKSALASPDMLPPVAPPRRGSSSVVASPSRPLTASAMSLDLDVGAASRSSGHAETLRTRVRESRSLGCLRAASTKYDASTALPPLFKSGAGLPLGPKSMAKMRSGSRGASIWGVAAADLAETRWQSGQCI